MKGEERQEADEDGRGWRGEGETRGRVDKPETGGRGITRVEGQDRPKEKEHLTSSERRCSQTSSEVSDVDTRRRFLHHVLFG